MEAANHLAKPNHSIQVVVSLYATDAILRVDALCKTLYTLWREGNTSSIAILEELLVFIYVACKPAPQRYQINATRQLVGASDGYSRIYCKIYCKTTNLVVWAIAVAWQVRRPVTAPYMKHPNLVSRTWTSSYKYTLPHTRTGHTSPILFFIPSFCCRWN